MSGQFHKKLPDGQAVSAASEARESGLRAALSSAVGMVLQFCIEWLVRLAGRKVERKDAPWLECVLGKPGLIGTGVYQQIAEEQGLVLSMPPDAGLIPDFVALRGPWFVPDAVDPRIRHFYEHAALYHLEVWSEVYLAGKLVLWLLVEFISRRMYQLNFPDFFDGSGQGDDQRMVQLRDRESGKLAHAGWLRRFRSTGKVIYAGLYSTLQVPGEANPCVKVTFPCYGSSNVYLRPCAYPDGTFGLVSTGAAFGKSGILPHRGGRARRVEGAGVHHAP